MDDYLAQRFEENRPRLTAAARRILGSSADAQDAVQEAWLRLDRADADSVENLPAWLTTVVARVCLNQLRSRRTRAEQPLDDARPADEPAVEPRTDAGADPEARAELGAGWVPARLPRRRDWPPCCEVRERWRRARWRRRCEPVTPGRP